MFCLCAFEHTAVVGICEEECALAVNHQNGCVDEKLSPERPVDTGVTGSWVKFQFGVNYGFKENEHFYGMESTMA